MTIFNYTMHKDVLEKSSVDNLTVFAIPDDMSLGDEKLAENKVIAEKLEVLSNELPTKFDRDEVAKLPLPVSDSRSLLEPIKTMPLNEDRQAVLKERIKSVINDAIMQAEARNPFNDIQKIRFNNGIKEALKNILRKLDSGVSIYDVLHHCRIKGELVKNLFCDDINDLETEYSRDYHLGLASAYSNLAETIKSKVADDEAQFFREVALPTVI